MGRGSDPYAVVWWDGESLGQTEVIDNTLDPVRVTPPARPYSNVLIVAYSVVSYHPYSDVLSAPNSVVSYLPTRMY